MDFNDLYEVGGDIMEAVDDAVRTNDYTKLSDSIRKTVVDVTEAMKRDVRDSRRDYAGGQDVRRRYYRSASGQGGRPEDDPDIYRRYRSSARHARRQAVVRSAGQQAAGNRRKVSGAKSFFFQKKVAKSNSISQIVAGVIGLVFSLPAVLSNGVDLLTAGGGFGAAFGLLASALIAAASAYFVIKGRKGAALVDRYKQYGNVIGTAEYIEIEKIARATGRTKEEVLGDLRQMIDNGFLKEAWIDEQETTLMLTESVYDQYQALREQRSKRLEQEEKILEEDADLPREAQQILREGRSYIQTIHQFNVDIPGEEMSEKLSKLENTMLRIVEQVREHPGSAGDLRKLMNYYLPTTVKLLSAYRELDRQTVKGDNIVNTKREIEDALDTINGAFENLLDSMFRDMAWDVSSDISVMQTMFAQDGLTPGEMSAQSGQSVAEKERQVYGTTVGQSWTTGQTQAAGQSMAAGQAQAAGQTAAAGQAQAAGQSVAAGQTMTSGGVQMQVGGSTLVWGDEAAEEKEQ